MDGKPCDGKLSRTVWGGGKLGDDIKELPIVKSVYPTAAVGVAHIESRGLIPSGTIPFCLDGVPKAGKKSQLSGCDGTVEQGGDTRIR